MAIASMDGLVAAQAINEPIPIYKASFTTQAAGSLASLWTAAGSPGAGATPASGAGAVPTNLTAGSLPFINPASPLINNLSQMSVTAATVGSFLLIDRVCHTAGLSGTSATAQTVNSTALTRYLGASRTDSATVTNTSDSVLDSSVVATDQGHIVTGTGVPAATFVGTVTPGTSFLLSSSPTSQVNVNANNNGTSVTITNPSGAQAYLEWYTATGATGATATISYTNQNGVAGQSATVAVPVSAKAGLMVPFTLASGDWGVQSVQTVTLSISTGTAGSFGVTLAQVLSPWLGVATANIAQSFDFAGVDLPIIANSACLALMSLASTTSTGTVLGNISITQA